MHTPWKTQPARLATISDKMKIIKHFKQQKNSPNSQPHMPIYQMFNTSEIWICISVKYNLINLAHKILKYLPLAHSWATSPVGMRRLCRMGCLRLNFTNDTIGWGIMFIPAVKVYSASTMWMAYSLLILFYSVKMSLQLTSLKKVNGEHVFYKLLLKECECKYLFTAFSHPGQCAIHANVTGFLWNL